MSKTCPSLLLTTQTCAAEVTQYNCFFQVYLPLFFPQLYGLYILPNQEVISPARIFYYILLLDIV